jgi:immune inhibitor A
MSTKKRPAYLLLVIAISVGLLSACGFGWRELARSEQETTPTEQPAVIVSEPPPVSAEKLLSELAKLDVPERDMAALAERLKGIPNVPRVVRETAAEYEIGDEAPFWISNWDTNESRQITAVLAHKSPHLYMWVEKGVEVDLTALQASAGFFETQTYPTDRAMFGSEWSPGIDGDVRLHILHASGLGESVGGYFSGADEVSKLAHPYSNEHEMFYVDIDNITVGGDYYDGLLAHEFQHMIHWYQDRNEETWLNEGFSELAVFLNGLDPGLEQDLFLGSPDLQLDDFDYEMNGGAHYTASYLFALYLWEQFGAEVTRAIVAEPENGAAGIEAVINEQANGRGFASLFADWAAALYLDDPELRDGRYGFQGASDTRPALTADLAAEELPTTEGQVHQFASDYIRLTGDSPVTMVFTGTRQVPLLATTAHDGDWFWWSNSGDDIDTALTRAFDLSDVEDATLDCWLWYDIEEDWDYAYLEVSANGGATWQILSTAHTSNQNPTGNSYGPGYTGKSGGGDAPEWIHEQVDLSAYAGTPILVRFEYITDDAVKRAGFVLDGVSIPELGYLDSFEDSASDWEAAGFVRTNNVLPQAFIVQLIELGQKPRVVELQTDGDGSGRWEIPLGDGLNEAVVVISGATPITLEPAAYEIQILPAGR